MAEEGIHHAVPLCGPDDLGRCSIVPGSRNNMISPVRHFLAAIPAQLSREIASSGEIQANPGRTEFDRKCGFGKPKACHSQTGTTSTASAATGRLPTHWHSMTRDRRGFTLPVAAAHTARDVVPAPHAPAARSTLSEATRPQRDGRRRVPVIYPEAPQRLPRCGPVCPCPEARRDAFPLRSSRMREVASHISIYRSLNRSGGLMSPSSSTLLSVPAWGEFPHPIPRV